MSICKLSGVLGQGHTGWLVRCPGEGCGKLLRLTRFGRLPTHRVCDATLAQAQAAAMLPKGVK